MKPGIQLLGNSSVCQGYVTRFKPFPTFLNCQSYFLPEAFVLKRSILILLCFGFQVCSFNIYKNMKQKITFSIKTNCIWDAFDSCTKKWFFGIISKWWIGTQYLFSPHKFILYLLVVSIGFLFTVWKVSCLKRQIKEENTIL